MTKFNSWAISIGFGLFWVGLRHLYVWFQAFSQMRMLNTGIGPIWCAIVFLYFVADVGLVLAYLYIERAPLGSSMPKGFPFWYIASDTIVLVFLVHLSFLCIDHTVYVQLDSIGLSFAYLIFLIAASCWAVIAGFKYLSIRKLYLRES